jgi:hypothetical protein
MSLNFEWDDEKAKKNLRNHQVSFEEAKSAFNDPFLITFPDPKHSIGEQRFLNIGLSARGRVLIVVHAERGENIRIISCRKATTSERRDYEEGNF